MGIKRFLSQTYKFVFDNNNYDKFHWDEKVIIHKKYIIDTSVMIIRKYPYGMGLLSCYLSFLGHLIHCKENGFSPYIDMKSHYYALSHSSKKERKRINAWEYYFNNISNISFSNLKNYKEIIYSSGYTPKNVMMLFDNTPITLDNIKMFCDIDKEYITLNDSLNQRFLKTAQALLSGKRTIGAIIREGYICYANSDNGINGGVNISQHPKQLTIQELCDELKAKLNEWGCEYIFIAAETTLIIDELKKVFSDKLLFTKRNRRNIKSFNRSEFSAARNDLFRGGRTRVDVNSDYLEEIFLLSKCTCLLASKCSGSVVASIWNRGQYEHLEIIQKGLY